MTVDHIVDLVVACIGALVSIVVAWLSRPKSQKKSPPGSGGSGGAYTMKETMNKIRNNRLFIYLVAPLMGGFIFWAGYGVASSKAITAPFEVPDYFFSSGWMGDRKDIQLNDQWRGKNCHTGSTCIKITYTPKGNEGWAGVYWQYPDKNWGEKPGRVVKNAKKVTFWARGENGGELVTFKAGGISGGKHEDSFEKVGGIQELTSDWKAYEIRLDGDDLSSVLGAFAWTASKTGNPNGLTFYLDEIRYE